MFSVKNLSILKLSV